MSAEIIQFVPRASKKVISDLDAALAELNQMSAEIFTELMLGHDFYDHRTIDNPDVPA